MVSLGSNSPMDMSDIHLGLDLAGTNLRHRQSLQQSPVGMRFLPCIISRVVCHLWNLLGSRNLLGMATFPSQLSHVH